MGAKDNYSESSIQEQLNLILSSPAFKGSRILSGFLEFVTKETLGGKEQELKEYTIGVHVLSRTSDFNPQLNSIVRIHAGRLRRALHEYYNLLGKDDPIRIEISKGSYVPSFISNQKTGSSQTQEKQISKRHRSVVAILPFRNISNDSSRDFFADGLGEQLSTELSWFQELAVISYYSSRHAAGITSDLKETASLLGAKYLLTGSIQGDDTHLRIRVQLILGDNGEQLWTKSFEKDNNALGILEIQNEIVRSIFTAVGGYYGAILRDVLKSPHNDSGNGIESLDAIFLYYHFQKVYTPEGLGNAINALEAAVKADPDYALAWAMLGELYLNDKVLEIKKIENPQQEGLKCALKAVGIDPNCQHAYQSLAYIYLFHNNPEECLKAVEQCIAINPNSSAMIGGMGFVLICAGEFDSGYALLNDAINHNPYCPWWFNGAYVLYYLYKKEYQKAYQSAEKIDRPEVLWDPLLKAAALGHLNRSQEASKYLTQLVTLLPDTINQVKNIAESFLLSKDLNKEIINGLRKAGLNEKKQPADIKRRL